MADGDSGNDQLPLLSYIGLPFSPIGKYYQSSKSCSISPHNPPRKPQEASTTSKGPALGTLGKFPNEIRQEIYSFAMETEEHMNIQLFHEKIGPTTEFTRPKSSDHERKQTALSLLTTSSAVEEDAGWVLFNKVKLQFNIDRGDWWSTFTRDPRLWNTTTRFRRIELVMKAEGLDTHEDYESTVRLGQQVNHIILGHKIMDSMRRENALGIKGNGDSVPQEVTIHFGRMLNNLLVAPIHGPSQYYFPCFMWNRIGRALDDAEQAGSLVQWILTAEFESEEKMKLGRKVLQGYLREGSENIVLSLWLCSFVENEGPK